MNDLTMAFAKQKIQSRIAALESELSIWRERFKNLDDVQKGIENLNTPRVIDHATPEKLQSPNWRHAFAASGLTEAIKGLLIGSKLRLNPPQVRDKLLEKGFKPEGKNFSISVGTTLKRLSLNNGVLLEEQLGKKRYYSDRKASV